MHIHLELNQFGRTCHAWVFLLKSVFWYHYKYTSIPATLVQQQPGTLLSGYYILHMNFRNISIRHSECQNMNA